MIKPQLCQPVPIEEARQLFATGDWVSEIKYDGIRGIIENGKLYDRRGQEITARFPEFDLSRFDKNTIIDGEIISQTGVFADISGRMHLKDPFGIKMAAKMKPAVFMAFDMLHNEKTDISKESLVIRRMELMGCVNNVCLPWIKLAEGVSGTPNNHSMDDFNRLWDEVELNGWEGVVIKRVKAPYEEGQRSPNWRKCKAFKEVEAVFTKLDVHNKGVRLETADGKSVNVNGAQSEAVKAAFDKDGKVSGEVQYLEQASGEWRFPSWKRQTGVDHE
jgi:ATP-dependent DNA ligase